MSAVKCEGGGYDSITAWSSLHMWVHYDVVITTYVGPLRCGHHYICGSIRVWSSVHMWVH